MQRYLGLDIGKQRTGVALVDDENRLATPLETIFFEVNSNQYIERLTDLIREWEAKLLIVGLPIDLKGKEAIAANEMRKTVEEMMKIVNTSLSKKGSENVEVIFIDERLTTAQAEKSLIQAQFSAEHRKKHRDSLAAALIAQTWVDTL